MIWLQLLMETIRLWRVQRCEYTHYWRRKLDGRSMVRAEMHIARDVLSSLYGVFICPDIGFAVGVWGWIAFPAPSCLVV